MNLSFDVSIVDTYKSNSQKIRVMSETWIAKNMYCPCCGNPHINKLENNSPVADMQCGNCGEIFELKAKEGLCGKKINDGAYSTMISRITSDTNPDLLVMNYSTELSITDLVLVPKFFFVPQIIEKRKPLAPTARRAGWTGCNILLSEIPMQGKINIIKDGCVRPADNVVNEYVRITKLKTNDLKTRGWLFDVLNCVNELVENEFSLHDIYRFVDVLKQKHTNNNNVEAKIRQQLQILRDKGFVEFLGAGHYRKIK